MSSEAYLIASLSGRVLAKAAARGGYPALGLDAFADLDSRALTRAWRRAGLDPDGAPRAAAWRAAARAFRRDWHCLGLVYGSGFEARPELPLALSDAAPVLGNRPEVLRAVADPLAFARRLARLGIPHPEVRLEPPAVPAPWLSKRAGACGGLHVRPAAERPDAEAGRYYQRRAAGVAWSLLFLADGVEALPVGFNRLLAAPPEAPSPWCYAGARRQAAGPAGWAEAAVAAARALTRDLGLRGLNGIDFMASPRHWALLELNPRPTATVELWDEAPMPPLFGLHLDACRGQLPEALPGLAGGRAAAVVYAGADIRVPPGFAWPAWCADLPEAGSRIRAGDPVCTVHAEGVQAMPRLRRRRRAVLDRLTGGGGASAREAAERHSGVPQPTCLAAP